VGFNLHVPQDLKEIDAPSCSIRVRLSTDRAWVASRLVRLLADPGRIDMLAGAEADQAASDLQTEEPSAVLLLDCAAFASQERLRLQRTARSYFPARVLWFLDAEPSSNCAVQAVLDAVKLGWCHGYIAGDCPFDSLVRAITAVARQDFWLPRAMLARALSESHGLRAGLGPPVAAVYECDRTLAQLTMRERQILRLVQRGLTNKEVGRHLGIEEDTVKKHLRNMYAKLGVHRRAQMLLRSVGELRASG
jgi:DNA-binding NarL/FixJ family response regulator